MGWLLNLRASDLPCTPLAVAYALVTMDACTLFIAPGRLSDADAATLAESGVTLRGYEEIIDAVHALPADEAMPIEMFLTAPPKPPIGWPLKRESTSMEP